MGKIKNITLKENYLISGYGVLSIAIYRYGNYLFRKIKLPIIYHLLFGIYKFLDFLIVQGINNCEIHYPTKIGKNLKLPHGGKGVIISSKAIIGNNVTIYHQVTIGSIENKGPAPIIGDNVFIGAGAKILGGVTLGNGVKVGANAVVIDNIPDNKTAVGIPAKYQ